jgi:hypothetical protein
MKRDGKLSLSSLFSFCSSAPLAQIRKVQLECGEKGFAETEIHFAHSAFACVNDLERCKKGYVEIYGQL